MAKELCRATEPGVSKVSECEDEVPLNLISPVSKMLSVASDRQSLVASVLSAGNEKQMYRNPHGVHTLQYASHYIQSYESVPGQQIQANQIYIDSYNANICDPSGSDHGGMNVTQSGGHVSELHKTINRMCAQEMSVDCSADQHLHRETANDQVLDFSKTSALKKLMNVVDSVDFPTRNATSFPARNVLIHVPEPFSEPTDSSLRPSCSVHPHYHKTYRNQQEKFLGSTPPFLPAYKYPCQTDPNSAEEQLNHVTEVLSPATESVNSSGGVFALTQESGSHVSRASVLGYPSSVHHNSLSFLQSVEPQIIHRNLTTSVLPVEMPVMYPFIPDEVSHGSFPMSPHIPGTRKAVPPPTESQNFAARTHYGAPYPHITHFQTFDRFVPVDNQNHILQPQQSLLENRSNGIRKKSPVFIPSPASNEFRSRNCNVIPPQNLCTNSLPFHYPSNENTCSKRDTISENHFSKNINCHDNKNAVVSAHHTRRKRGRPSMNSKYARQVNLESEVGLPKHTHSTVNPVSITQTEDRKIFHYSSGRVVSLQTPAVNVLNHVSEMPTAQSHVNSVSLIQSHMSSMPACASNSPQEVLHNIACASQNSIGDVGHSLTHFPASCKSLPPIQSEVDAKLPALSSADNAEHGIQLLHGGRPATVDPLDTVNDMPVLNKDIPTAVIFAGNAGSSMPILDEIPMIMTSTVSDMSLVNDDYAIIMTETGHADNKEPLVYGDDPVIVTETGNADSKEALLQGENPVMTETGNADSNELLLQCDNPVIMTETSSVSLFNCDELDIATSTDGAATGMTRPRNDTETDRPDIVYKSTIGDSGQEDSDALIIDEDAGFINFDDIDQPSPINETEESTPGVTPDTPKGVRISNDDEIKIVITLPCEEDEQESWKISSTSSYIAQTAFQEGRYNDVFQIIRDNEFPDEHKPHLRTIWTKSLYYNYTRVTNLPISARQRLILNRQNPPPDTISETPLAIFAEKGSFEVITVE